MAPTYAKLILMKKHYFHHKIIFSNIRKQNHKKVFSAVVSQFSIFGCFWPHRKMAVFWEFPGSPKPWRPNKKVDVHTSKSISDGLHKLNWWSGLQKDLRKDKTADLQEAFINLAKSVEADPPPELLAAERSRDATGNFGEVRPRKFEGECFASVVRYQIH